MLRRDDRRGGGFHKRPCKFWMEKGRWEKEVNCFTFWTLQSWLRSFNVLFFRCKAEDSCLYPHPGGGRWTPELVIELLLTRDEMHYLYSIEISYQESLAFDVPKIVQTWSVTFISPMLTYVNNCDHLAPCDCVIKPRWNTQWPEPWTMCFLMLSFPSNPLVLCKFFPVMFAMREYIYDQRRRCFIKCWYQGLTERSSSH